MTRPLAQELQMRLGESWVMENDNAFVVSESSTSDGDDHQSSEVASETRETRRRSVRSRVVPAAEPELVMPALDPCHVDQSVNDGAKRAPRKPVPDAYLGRRRSPRLAMADQIPTSHSSGYPIPRPKKASRRLRKEKTQEPFSEVMTEALTSFGRWLLDTLQIVVSLLRYPASLLVAALIAVMLVWYCITSLPKMMTRAITAPFSPICHLPVMSTLCQLSRPAGESKLPVEFDEMMNVQAKFEEILESSAESVALPLDMKRGEASIRDLRQLVRYSSLRSK